MCKKTSKSFNVERTNRPQSVPDRSDGPNCYKYSRFATHLGELIVCIHVFVLIFSEILLKFLSIVFNKSNSASFFFFFCSSLIVDRPSDRAEWRLSGSLSDQSVRAELLV